MWQIHLEQFEGPLDLLLALVEREKLEITELSLARVCEQYRAYLQLLRDLDLDLESSYLVVLAQLVELKSKALLPEEPELPIYDDVWMDEQPPDDPLVKKLREYKRIKEAALLLGVREREALSSFPRPSGVRQPEEATDLSEVSLVDLLDALKKLLVQSERRAPVLQMARVMLSVPQRMQQIWHRVLAGSSRLD
ncbi:MAG: segregation and condensation protein A, partial [Candidatus Xenobia bacterium]